MKIFLDSADIIQIKELNMLGIVDGVTTNPTLIKKSGRNYFDVIEEICTEVNGPVSAEVVAQDSETMIKEGLRLSEIAKNVVVKIPFTLEGLKASLKLSLLKKQINMTLCFSASQALVAAKIGVDFISPFVGRLDDITADGMDLISTICSIYRNYNFATKVLVASVRNVNHVIKASLIGAHVVTLPPSVVYQMLEHPLTTKGLEIFNKDWSETKQSIM